MATKGTECTDEVARAALERLFSGALEGTELQTLRDHALQCQSCAEQCERIGRMQVALGASTAPIETPDFMLGEKWRWAPWIGTALSVALMVVMVRIPISLSGSEFRARGSARQAFGVRGFCVDLKEEAVIAEAQPGQKLRCPHGSALQLTYTSPKEVQVQIEVQSGGKRETLFPRPGDHDRLAAGTDVPLSFSTGVNSSWLPGPAKLVATFADQQSGKIVAESGIGLEP